MMKWIEFVLTVNLLAVCVDAAELIPKVTIEGKVYQDVRWGPVNQGKVVMFHSRGNLTVPLSSLPKEYQELLGYQPPPPSTTVTPPATTTTPTPPPPELPKIVIPAPSRAVSSRDPDWEVYSRDRKTKLVLKDKLVERAILSPLVGFIGNPVRIYTDSVKVRGITLELAERKNGTTQPANEFSLRPNLWQRTGKMVLLRNYKPEAEIGVLVRVFVVPAEDVDEHTSYDVATEPTFEQWKQLHSRFP